MCHLGLYKYNQTAWQEALILRCRASFHQMPNWPPRNCWQRMMWRGAQAKCGRDSGCHCPRQTLHPLSPVHQTGHHTSNFPPLRLSTTSGNLSRTNRELRQNKRLQNYVWEQQRSVQSKHRIPEEIWLHGQTLLCKRQRSVWSEAWYGSITLLP